jgi:hypothetical protein
MYEPINSSLIVLSLVILGGEKGRKVGIQPNIRRDYAFSSFKLQLNLNAASTISN